MRESDFERLYGEHASSLLGFLVYRTGDRAVAEDLLGETFERVIRSRRRFDPRRGSEKTWIYAIALNCLRDRERRRQAERRAVERVGAETEALQSGSSIEQVEMRDDLARALRSLTAEERETLALRYGADMTVPEIAALTREKLTTVEGRVYRGLRKLRDELHG